MDQPLASDNPQIVEEAPLKYTLFHIPPPVAIKNASGNYMKSDAQSVWVRGAPDAIKRKQAAEGKAAQPQHPALDPSAPRGSDIIVIHPGSRWIRIGRASDPFPLSIPHVIARKVSPDFKRPPPLHRIPGLGKGPKSRRPSKSADKRPPTTSGHDAAMDVDGPQEDPLPEHDFTDAMIVEAVNSIRSALISRMDFYKIPHDIQESAEAAAFNAALKPDRIEDENDSFRVEWIHGKPEEQVFVGHKVFRLADPKESGYHIRWPIYGNTFNTRDYESVQAVLNDIERIWETIIVQELRIDRKDFQHHSVVLVVPDYFDKQCVTNLVQLLLVHMSFRRVSIQQAGYTACLGAGLSTACIVDIGAVKSSVSCVEDGLVLSDTRMVLDFGGDDITEFLHFMMGEIRFPYRNMDLNRLYDLHVMDDLKARMCTLSEAEVTLRSHEFFVRAPNRQTEKYVVKAYDQAIVAPMCIFEPKIIDFDGKTKVNPRRWVSELVDEGDLGSDHPTAAMVISTQHLLPPEGVQPGKYPPVDIRFEASKLPIDVAIFNSVRAAGVEKIKRFLQAVLIVGGSSLVPGMVHALESRLQAIAFPLVPGIERLSVLTSPPDVDPRVLAWKGVTILSKLDLLNDMWVTPGEWDLLGIRALRERSLIEKTTAGP